MSMMELVEDNSDEPRKKVIMLDEDLQHFLEDSNTNPQSCPAIKSCWEREF